MHRARTLFLIVAACMLPMGGVSVCAAQDPPVQPLTFPSAQSTSPATKPPKKPEGSLRVSLRQEDDSAFVGAADVRLMPSEGYEASGTPTGSEGETLFTGLAAGKYMVEASAPGYLAVRMSTEIEAGHRERILYVVMKPRPMAKKVEKPKEAGPAASTVAPFAAAAIPAGANAIVETAKPEAAWARDFRLLQESEMGASEVDPNVECPAPKVLNGVGERMKEFVSNLERFTATEVVEHYPLDAGRRPRPPDKRRYTYVVTITQNSLGTFLLDEYRDGNVDPESFPGKVVTIGLPALDLIFHPVLAGDFTFACEGLGQMDGRAAWQVHFAQRGDRLVRIRSYKVGERTYSVYLEGRAWIDPGSYQVVRLETSLQKPIPEIELKQERIAIEYASVQFQAQKSELWLPQAAQLYVDRRGHPYYRRHTFTDFKVFNVETAQSIQAPKGSYSFTNNSDQDIAGVLTVIPEDGAKRETVSVNIVVPARGRVFKVVGLGKDVNLPASAVASATFAYDGKPDTVKVDANLVKQTTLDVIPETNVSGKP
jgi:hypothetical protein